METYRASCSLPKCSLAQVYSLRLDQSFVDIKFPGSAYDLVDQLKQAHRANLKPNTCQPLGLLEGKALDVVTFEEICPSPSARMVDEFAGVIFARMGEGRSDCGEWTVTMGELGKL